MNSRHPGTRRVWNPGSDRHAVKHFRGPPGKSYENSGKRKLAVKNNDLSKFSRKMTPQKRSQGPGASLVQGGAGGHKSVILKRPSGRVSETIFAKMDLMFHRKRRN